MYDMLHGRKKTGSSHQHSREDISKQIGDTYSSICRVRRGLEAHVVLVCSGPYMPVIMPFYGPDRAYTANSTSQG